MRIYRAVMAAAVIYLLCCLCSALIAAAAAADTDDGQPLARAEAERSMNTFVVNAAPAPEEPAPTENDVEADADPAFVCYAEIPLPEELQRVLWEECGRHGLPYALGLGLIDGESGFRADAISSEGCYGYCQLNPRFFPADLEPADNIRAGIEFLANQIERYGGDVAAGLTAYNAGHDNGTRWYAEYIMDKAFKWAFMLEET